MSWLRHPAWQFGSFVMGVFGAIAGFLALPSPIGVIAVCVAVALLLLFATQQLRSESGVATAASQRSDSTATVPSGGALSVDVLVLDAEGAAIEAASVALVAPNKTRFTAETGRDGRATISCKPGVGYTVFCSHPQYAGYLARDVELRRSLKLQLSRSGRTGSLIVLGSGYIPGLDGRLNPIRDSLDRLYLYADNIAINGGQQQPADFKPSRAFELEDRWGRRFSVRALELIGDTCLLEYEPLT